LVSVLASMTGAFAAPEAADKPADDEIIVYGDQFARWDNTRWLLQSELLLPLGMDFASDDNKGFRSFGFQIRAVVLCDKDAQLSKKRWEVSCAIEDIGILATTENRWRTDVDRALADGVLADVDARLTKATVQMQVDEEGGITNFDIEGIDATNVRERRIQETTRQMMARVMSGFHLRIPDQAQRTGQWVEYNSELIDLPSIAAARGSSMLLHQVSPYKDSQLVQTVGEGAVTVNLPKDSRDPFSGASANLDSITNTTAPSGIGGPAPRQLSSVGAASTYTDRESTIPATFKVEASGVALFEKSSGIMTERVWQVTGRATASMPWGLGPFRNVGRIRLLDKDEAIDMGPSQQVSWPSQPLDGLAPWVPIEVMPGGGAG
jgi:hypothetical protein